MKFKLSSGFKPKENVQASTGLRMQFSDKVDVLPGMPFMAFNENKKKIEEEFKKEISEIKRQEKADWGVEFSNNSKPISHT